MWDSLEDFAKRGLRTLLVARRVIPTELYRDWNERYLQACAAIEGRDELMDGLQSEVETGL
jgi:hypothetical protein